MPGLPAGSDAPTNRSRGGRLCFARDQYRAAGLPPRAHAGEAATAAWRRCRVTGGMDPGATRHAVGARPGGRSPSTVGGLLVQRRSRPARSSLPAGSAFDAVGRSTSDGQRGTSAGIARSFFAGGADRLPEQSDEQGTSTARSDTGQIERPDDRQHVGWQDARHGAGHGVRRSEARAPAGAREHGRHRAGDGTARVLRGRPEHGGWSHRSGGHSRVDRCGCAIDGAVAGRACRYAASPTRRRNRRSGKRSGRSAPGSCRPPPPLPRTARRRPWP